MGGNKKCVSGLISDFSDQGMRFVRFDRPHPFYFLQVDPLFFPRPDRPSQIIHEKILLRRLHEPDITFFAEFK